VLGHEKAQAALKFEECKNCLPKEGRTLFFLFIFSSWSRQLPHPPSPLAHLAFWEVPLVFLLPPFPLLFA
jgi:hypothetical protein